MKPTALGFTAGMPGGIPDSVDWHLSYELSIHRSRVALKIWDRARKVNIFVGSAQVARRLRDKA